MSQSARLTGQLPMQLGQAVSDAIHAAVARGMEVDEAVCVTAAVAADYARRGYGDAYLAELAKIVLARASEPLPTGA